MPANSDYFPILQLESPKARFMNISDKDLLALQVAPWPILEATAGYQPMPVSNQMGLVATTLWRDGRQRIARELRQALLDNATVNMQFTQGTLLSKLGIMQMIARGCQFNTASNEWIEASAAIAGATIPFLRADDLNGVWVEPSWLGHCAASNPLVDQALHFYAALAARDWKQVASDGMKILTDERTSGLMTYRGYVLGATELAALALGDFDAVPRIETAYGASIHGFELERHWLLVFAAFRKPAIQTTQ